MTRLFETRLSKRALIAAVFAVLAATHVCPAAMAPGDLAIIGYRSVDADAIAFVVLSPIAADEVIRFTDSGWYLAGGFRATEGGVQYTASAALTPSTVITRSNPFTSGGWSVNSAGLGSGGFLLAIAGDQVLVFEGDASSPAFIYAINADSAGWSDAINSNTTALPTGLTDGTTAVNMPTPPERDNAYYNGITTGTPAELLAAIGDPGNWVTDDNPQTWPSWSFTVNGGGGPSAPAAYAGEDRMAVLSSPIILELLVDATANDADGLAGLTYEWTPATAPGIVSWTNRTGAVTAPTDPSQAQVTLDQTGVYTFTLTVTDPDLLTGQDTVVLTVVDPGPMGEYDPPPDYYDPARPGGVWYTGPTLKDALYNIISGHIVRSYDSAQLSLQLLDEDPYNPANLILIYTGDSVPKPWDGGVTWNREHMWPDSLNPSGPCDTDVFHLRPCNPSVNSSRGNKPYGLGAGYWDPNQGAVHRGDASRAMFYMATRYTDLTLVDGQPGPPGSNEMGDLVMLLVWHYEDPVNDGERRRNHLIYSSTDNPSYYQGNRNPFVDHPELVWTIWGTGPNDAQLYVGDTPPADGTSSVLVDLGPVLKDGPPPSAQAATLHKTGANPTTYAVTAAGDAVSPSIGPRQAFVGGPASRNVTVGLSSSTATPGLKTGSLIVDNTE
ncbi:MAG: endonuclease, partial [Planctomycetota bacterium]